MRPLGPPHRTCLPDQRNAFDNQGSAPTSVAVKDGPRETHTMGLLRRSTLSGRVELYGRQALTVTRSPALVQLLAHDLDIAPVGAIAEIEDVADDGDGAYGRVDGQMEKHA